MGSHSSTMKPHELVEHRKLNTAIENVEIPARAESRTLTDKKGFLIFGIAILVLIPFLAYTLAKSDLRHLTHHTDHCGNFCGEKNEKVDGIPCSGKDYTRKMFGDGSRCLENCEPNRIRAGQPNCSKSWTELFDDDTLEEEPVFPNEIFSKNSDDRVRMKVYSNLQGWKFFASILIAIGLSILTLILLRIMPAPVVWFIVIFCMTVLALTILGLWFLYFSVSSHSSDFSDVMKDSSRFGDSDTDLTVASTPLLALAVVWTLIAGTVIIIFIVLFKKIGLVVQLYKEATKALAAMPLLLLVPIITVILQVAIIFIAICTTCHMAVSRETIKIIDDYYVYHMTGVMVFAIIFNLVVTSWTMRFLDGIQYMIVSGSVSTWFFARNKDYLGSPIYTNVKIVLRYHVGTAAFGSFVLTVFAVVKSLLRCIFRNACCRCLCVMCCTGVEVVLRFFSENAYIQTAMHGQSFLRSAKRATKLLMANLGSVIAIDCVGDFVLFIIILILTIISTAISYTFFQGLGPELAVFPTCVCFILNMMTIAIIFNTFQAIIDTLFLCFCEDSVLNDGMAKPYYMSRGLMEFVENSKKMYGDKR